jgi:hypothetical protein
MFIGFYVADLLDGDQAQSMAHIQWQVDIARAVQAAAPCS